MGKEFISIYKDILHIYLNNTILNKPYSYHKYIYPKGRLWFSLVKKNMFDSFKDLFFTIIGSKKYSENDLIVGKSWFVIESKNNFDALKDVKFKTANSVFIGNNIIIENVDIFHLFPHKYRFMHLWRFPFLLFYFWKMGYSPKKNFYLFLVTCGLYESYRIILKRQRPKIIIFANDHVYYQRALLLAAKSVGIKTVYIQHATVTNSFPPIRYDLVLLDGEDAKNKYIECSGEVFKYKYIGMPKFDKYQSYRKTSMELNTIGIALNIVDDLKKALFLVKEISKTFPNLNIIVRLHPSDIRDISSFSKYCSFSNSKIEGVFEYLKQIDINIACHTSTHLEATLLNIPSIFYDIGEYEVGDYYGFQKNKLTFYANTLEDVLNFIKDRETLGNQVFLRAKPYNELVGTEQDGQSVELAVKYISEFI